MSPVKHIHIFQGKFMITVSGIKLILNNMRFFAVKYTFCVAQVYLSSTLCTEKTSECRIHLLPK